MYVRCDRCRGQKKVRGLGMMLRKCDECTGTGYKTVDEVVKDIVQAEQKIEDGGDVVKATKRKSVWSKKDASE